MSEYAWMCLNKQDFEYAWGPKYAKILNMLKFSIWQRFHCASVTQHSEYVRICLGSVLNISWVLNMPGFWIWKGSEYARVTLGSRSAKIWLNMSEQDVNMPGYVWIFNIRQGSDVSYNTQLTVILQVNEYLLRDRHIQNMAKDLRWSTLEK